MRGEDPKQEAMFSYVSPEQRVPLDHPLRPIREMVDTILKVNTSWAILEPDPVSKRQTLAAASDADFKSSGPSTALADVTLPEASIATSTLTVPVVPE